LFNSSTLLEHAQFKNTIGCHLLFVIVTITNHAANNY